MSLSGGQDRDLWQEPETQRAEEKIRHEKAGVSAGLRIVRMECLSRLFQRLVREILDSDRLLVATIAQHGGGLIEDVKGREDVRIYTLTPQNREAVLENILAELRRLNAGYE